VRKGFELFKKVTFKGEIGSVNWRDSDKGALCGNIKGLCRLDAQLRYWGGGGRRRCNTSTSLRSIVDHRSMGRGQGSRERRFQRLDDGRRCWHL